VLTAASETLRLSGIDEDINTSGRYQAVKPRILAMDRLSSADDIRRLLASPDIVVGSVAALTETGSLVVASANGSQLPAYAGGAAGAIWIVGAQKVLPDLSTALRRVEDHCLPLESARTQGSTGGPAPSTAFSSSTRNPTPDAAPSCCSAKPSASEPPRVIMPHLGPHHRIRTPGPPSRSCPRAPAKPRPGHHDPGGSANRTGHAPPRPTGARS
jgi:hypothetical protein